MNWRASNIAYAVGIGIVVLLVIVAGVHYYVRSNRQAHVREAVQNLVAASSWHVDSELLLNLPVRLRDRERPITAVTIQVAGDAAKNESGTPEFTGTLYMGGTWPGTELYANGDIRIFDESVAFRLDKLSLFINPSGNLINKWTHVAAPLLQTHNSADVQATVADIVRGAEYTGREEWHGASAWRYNVTLAPEHKKQLISVLQKGASHNQAFHVVARLLEANDVQSLTFYVDPSERQLAGVGAVFVKPLKDGTVFERARLSVVLSEYGKPVTIEEPPRQLTVRPDVFARLFGSGEIDPQ